MTADHRRQIFLKNLKKAFTHKFFRDTFARPKLLKNIHPEKALKTSLECAVSKIPIYHHIKMDHSAGFSKEVLAQFPIIGKKDLLTKKALFYPPKRPWFAVGKTSGTTGTPLEIYRDLKSSIFENAFIRRHWALSGFKNLQKRATMRGDMVVPIDQEKPPFWFFNIFDNQLLISSRHLKEGCFEPITDKLESFKPYILEAYPSTAYELALYLNRKNRMIRIPYIYTSSEMLYDHQRAMIEKQFCGKVMDFYGMAERVALASECLQGNLHINTDYSCVEILDKNGNPTEDYGHITGTTLHNHAMPLVRYQLSDITRWKSGDCPCGSPFPMIEPIQGKFEDILYGGKGAPVSPSVLTFAFKGLAHIKRSQVAQTEKDKWEVRVVPDREFTDQESQKLISNIKTMVDPYVNLEIKIVEDIPRSDSGKFKWVVNEYNAGKN